MKEGKEAENKIKIYLYVYLFKHLYTLKHIYIFIKDNHIIIILHDYINIELYYNTLN